MSKRHNKQLEEFSSMVLDFFKAKDKAEYHFGWDFDSLPEYNPKFIDEEGDDYFNNQYCLEDEVTNIRNKICKFMEAYWSQFNENEKKGE